MKVANDDGLRFLSVCSGIEAASVAFGPLGWQAVAFSEIEKFPSAVLAYHYPDVPNLGDFTKIDTTKLGRVDILCGGTPCQSFSVAGMRRGLEDDRGNLTLKFVELAHELSAGNGLRNVVWENVVGVLSDKSGAFGCFIAGLVGADSPIAPPRRWTNAGMVSGPKGRAAWRVLDAQYFGVAQRRRRVIVVADFGNGADPAAVLFEPEGVRRHSPPSREKGEGVASAAKSGVGGGSWPAEVASTLDTAFGPKQGLDDQHINAGAPYFVPQAVCATGDLTHTLKAEGADASEDGTGRGTPIVCFSAKDYGADAGELAPTLRAGGHKDSHANAGCMPAVAYQAQGVSLRGREGGATAELGGEVATALRASSGGGDKPHVLTSRIGTSYADAIPINPHSAVRRLTPRECERLMGFPDDYTRIPYGSKKQIDEYEIEYMRATDPDLTMEEARRLAADGPRYKALGNSWAVPKFRWLGERLQRLMSAANDNKEAARDAA